VVLSCYGLLRLDQPVIVEVEDFGAITARVLTLVILVRMIILNQWALFCT
jgi:hypothetical protein